MHREAAQCGDGTCRTTRELNIGQGESWFTGDTRSAGNNLVDVNAAELRELAANALAAAAELDALTGAG
jgi:hypothetical protein